MISHLKEELQQLSIMPKYRTLFLIGKYGNLWCTKQIIKIRVFIILKGHNKFLQDTASIWTLKINLTRI